MMIVVGLFVVMIGVLVMMVLVVAVVKGSG